MGRIHTLTFNTLKGMCFTNYDSDVCKAITQDIFSLKRLRRQKSLHRYMGKEVMVCAIENE